MSIHEGHRARKKEQFRRHGLDAFADHEVLELLLFYALPRQDTNAVAHALLRRFGTLEAVFSADAAELCRVEGIGEHAATLISLMLPLFRRLRSDMRRQELPMTTAERAGSFYLDVFFGEKSERLYLAALDGKGRLLANILVGEGGGDLLGFNVRRIAELALSTGAESVILAHNHPSGIALPSAEDRAATAKIAAALAAIHVSLADHIVVADEDFVSMRESGMPEVQHGI